jgi:L-seryl-tRNA(Ser) seleniumtransferase
MISAPLSSVRGRAEALAGALRLEPGLNATVVPAESFIGGGSAPVNPIPTAAVAISPPFPAPYDSDAALARALRLGDPPVIGRIQKGVVLLDLRSVPPDLDLVLLDSVRKVCHDRSARARANGPPPPESAVREAPKDLP